jgi:virginiamycin B lyase
VPFLLTTLAIVLSGQTLPIKEYPLSVVAGDITSGPDGALWFTTLNTIARITTSGVSTNYPLPGDGIPAQITLGPDGALWYTHPSNTGGTDRIGRITTSGAITEYPIPTPASGAEGITTGPDGALWFTEFSKNTIGRITTLGAFTEYIVPTPNAQPTEITAGPDGALWFTESGTGKIGRITTAGAFTEFLIPTSNSKPYGITAGPDGAIWFVEFFGGKVGRITPLGAITEYLVPTAQTQPCVSTGLGCLGKIKMGPDGALWFTESYHGKIGRITVAGIITEYTVSSANPVGITAGPDDAIWYTGSTPFVVGRIDISANLPMKALPQVAFGGGWYTALYFYNSNGTQASVGVTLWNSDGTPLTIPGATGPSTNLTLLGKGTRVLELPNSGGLRQGWAQLVLPTGVTSYGVFRQTVPGLQDQEAIVPISSTSSASSVLIFDDTAYTTAVAYANPSGASTAITITARDENGQQIGTSTVNLSPNTRTAVAVRSVIGLEGVVGKRGSLTFSASQGAVVVLGLRFNGAAFTSIPAVQN